MKTLSASASEQEHPYIMFYRIVFSLLLLAALFTLGRSALTRFKASSAAPTPGLSQLDSFSEPAVAATLLKFEANRVFSDYIEHLDAPLPAPAVEVGSVGPHLDTLLAGLEELHHQVRDLDTDLDHMLIAVYQKNSLEKEFLEHYLEHLRTHQEDPFLVSAAWQALVRAERCQRTGELLDAIADISAFHPELKSGASLARVVQEWQATKGARPDASHQ